MSGGYVLNVVMNGKTASILEQQKLQNVLLVLEEKRKSFPPKSHLKTTVPCQIDILIYWMNGIQKEIQKHLMNTQLFQVKKFGGYAQRNTNGKQPLQAEVQVVAAPIAIAEEFYPGLMI